MASRPMRESGVTVWPMVVSTMAPMPDPTATNSPRRSSAGIAGASTLPALLCASGFSLHGISVSTSASTSFACRPYLMSGSLTPRCTRIEPITTYARYRWVEAKDHGQGYQSRVFRNPVVSWTIAEETSTKTESRSIAWPIERIGGQRNRLG